MKTEKASCDPIFPPLYNVQLEKLARSPLLCPDCTQIFNIPIYTLSIFVVASLSSGASEVAVKWASSFLGGGGDHKHERNVRGKVEEAIV